MSAEAEVTDALQEPIRQNPQTAEEVKKMLAKLESEDAKEETEAKDDSKPEEAANRQEAGAKSELTADKNDDESTRKLSNVDRSPERRRGDRYERGGRGRGRGGRGAYMGRPSRHNIKSDLTTQEESDDPVAIRKQVGSAILGVEIRC